VIVKKNGEHLGQDWNANVFKRASHVSDATAMLTLRPWTAVL
jgi:hypothetical protein